MPLRYLAHAEVDDPFCDYMQRETPAAGFAMKPLDMQKCTIPYFVAVSSAGSNPLTPCQHPELMKAAAGRAVPHSWYEDIALSLVLQCVLLW